MYRTTLAFIAATAAATAPAFAQGADDCAAATPITGNGPFAFDTGAATTDGLPDLLCDFFGNQEIFNDVWFAWTAPTSSNYIVSTCGASGDTKIAVYAGACGTAPTECNDDSCGLLTEVTFSTTGGQTYLIRVGNYADGGGSLGDITINEDAPLLNPANGHYYDLVNDNLSWTDAKAAAEATLWQGVPGHLVTITDQAELDWILANLAPGRPWIGLSQNTMSATYAEPAGGFEWVTGEPFTFSNWSPGEPNDISASGGPENYIEMFGNGAWNDAEEFHAPTNQYIIEWGSGTGIGTNYCAANANSTGVTGVISASGTPVVASNDLTLIATDIPRQTFGFFLTSATQGVVPNPGGSEGNLCLGGAIGRYVGAGQIMNSGLAAEISLLLDLNQLPQPNGLQQVMPGQTWNFQLWHRDSVGGNATSNFTNGIEILFL